MGRKYLGGLTALFVTLLALSSGAAGADGKGLPRTGFETSDGSSWTTSDEETRFLHRVDRMSERAAVDMVARTKGGNPLRLVKLGAPNPHSRGESRRRPTLLVVCSQHGDEPAAREACLMLVRDLAFTFGRAYVRQLRNATILVMPDANPDGRAAGTPGNAQGKDVARDHMNLASREARGIARVLRDWRPDVVLDLHDHGPSAGSGHDGEVLYTWPRDLNVDEQVHDLSMDLGQDYVEAQEDVNGYTGAAYDTEELEADDPHRSMGDDEGALVNAAGLRHALGLLVESAVTTDADGGSSDEAAVNRRRVDSHMVALLATLQFLRRDGSDVSGVTAAAARRKTKEGRERSAPVYFDGSDTEEPTSVQDPPPCGYLLTDAEYRRVGGTMALLDIAALGAIEGVFVPMGQPAEPLIPLLLDARAPRHEVSATPETSC